MIIVREQFLKMIARGEGRMWLYYPYRAGDIVRFDNLDLAISIDDIYENVKIG